MTPEEETTVKCQRAKQAAAQLAYLSSQTKNQALLAMADQLIERQQFLLEANSADVKAAQEQKASEAMVDRLLLSEKRIDAMSEGLREVAQLPDPVGEIIAGWKRPNGLEIKKVRVPLGVVGIIYESRPDVTVDAAGLCLKAGNAVVLRGGSEAINSNIALAKIISRAATQAGVPEGTIEIIETTDRAAAQQLMRLNSLVDVLIPRGGAGLIQSVIENATVPVIETGLGNCHIFVDASADLAMAEEIVINAKCQRPAVCNAVETLLVDESVASKFLPSMIKRLSSEGVEVRGCAKTARLISGVKEAAEEDWETEYLALILAVKVVADLKEAIAHITQYGTKHSEAIITQDYPNAQEFVERIDAAAVFVNASTRFTDGNQFGLGAEIGISTQKLHARGPMGLEELTSYKYVVAGSGQVRE